MVYFCSHIARSLTSQPGHVIPVSLEHTCVPGERGSHGHLRCPCTQSSSLDAWRNARKFNNNDFSSFVINIWMEWLYLFFRKQLLSCYLSLYAMEVCKFRTLKGTSFLNLSCKMKYVTRQWYLKKREKKAKNLTYMPATFFFHCFLLTVMHPFFFLTHAF